MGKKFKSLPRCAVSNKVINGKEVVLTDFALDYVKMQGYVVVERRRILNKAIAVCIMFCMVALIVMIPTVKAGITLNAISILTPDEQKLLSSISNSCSDVKTIVNKGDVKIMGTEYIIGDYGTIFLQLKDGSGEPVNNGSCYLNVNYPASYNISHSLWIADSPMIYKSSSEGIYYYDAYLPNYTGVYMVTANCVYIDNPVFYFEPYSTSQSLVSLEAGTYTGDTVSLNSFADGVYTKCVTSGGSGTKYCIENYTFNVPTAPVKLDLYWSGSTSQEGTLIYFSIWNYTSGSWYYLPNFVISAGSSTVSVSSAVNEFSTNSIPYNDANFRSGNQIKIRVNSSGIIHTRYNNWLSLKASQNNTFIQDVKGSSEMHISEGLNSLNNSINNIPYAIWNYAGTISSNVLNQTASSVWSYTNRTLTYVQDVFNYSKIAELPSVIWNYAERTLTYYPENNISVEDIWDYGTRELTYYPVVNLSLSNVSASEITDKIKCYLEQINAQENGEWNINIVSC